MLHCESNFNPWHQLSWFLSKLIDPWILEFAVSNTTGKNQLGNCISLYFYFRGLSEPRNPQKLKPYIDNEFKVF